MSYMRTVSTLLPLFVPTSNSSYVPPLSPKLMTSFLIMIAICVHGGHTSTKFTQYCQDIWMECCVDFCRVYFISGAD